jgi:hypothetical protein
VTIFTDILNLGFQCDKFECILCPHSCVALQGMINRGREFRVILREGTNRFRLVFLSAEGGGCGLLLALL